MAKKTSAYVDTGALIAFLDRSDTHHPKFLKLFENPPSLVSTPLVINEGHAWFLKRFDRYRALEFLNFIEEIKTLELLPVGEVEIKEASNLIRKFSDQNLTLTDAVGLHLMKKSKISSCWATDHHMGLMGVPLVIHS